MPDQENLMALYKLFSASMPSGFGYTYVWEYLSCTAEYCFWIPHKAQCFDLGQRCSSSVR